MWPTSFATSVLPHLHPAGWGNGGRDGADSHFLAARRDNDRPGRVPGGIQPSAMGKSRQGAGSICLGSASLRWISAKPGKTNGGHGFLRGRQLRGIYEIRERNLDHSARWKWGAEAGVGWRHLRLAYLVTRWQRIPLRAERCPTLGGLVKRLQSVSVPARVAAAGVEVLRQMEPRRQDLLFRVGVFAPGWSPWNWRADMGY